MSNLVVVFYEKVEYSTWIPLYFIVTKTQELHLKMSTEMGKPDKITEMYHCDLQLFIELFTFCMMDSDTWI